MARITPSQPNDAMARIASRRNRTFFGRRFKIVLEGFNRFEKGLGDEKQYKNTHQSVSQSEAAILRSAYSGFCWIPPVLRRLFEVNSEPHTGARPSVRLCVGLIILLEEMTKILKEQIPKKNTFNNYYRCLMDVYNNLKLMILIIY